MLVNNLSHHWPLDVRYSSHSNISDKSEKENPFYTPILNFDRHLSKRNFLLRTQQPLTQFSLNLKACNGF